MKSVLFLIFLHLSYAAFSQTPLTDGEPAPINDHELLVVPLWGPRPTAGYINTVGVPVARGGKSKPIDPADIDDWLRKYNKIKRTDYTVNFQCISAGSFVLITKEQKSKEDADNAVYVPVVPAALPEKIPYMLFTESLRYDMKRMYLELILKPNKKCKVRLSPSINYKNILDIPSQVAYAKAAVGKNDLANGRNLIQFYRDSTDTYPAYYYLGELKNGVPDGHGFFARMNRASGTIIIRIGNWKNGQFLDEQTAKLFADSILARSVTQMDLTSLKYNFNEIVYEQDVLNPVLTNGFSNIFSATWGDSTSQRYVYASFKGNDFFSYPRFTLLGKDPATRINFTNHDREAKRLPSPGDLLLGAFTRAVAGHTYNMDEYTQITEGGSYKCNPRLIRTEVSTTYNYTTGMTSGETMRTEDRTETPVYGYDQCRSYTVRIRDSRSSDDWKTVASFGTTQMLDGTGGWTGARQNSIHINGFAEKISADEYFSNTDALNAVLKIVRENNPYPVQDTTVKRTVKKPVDEVSANKLDLLIRRIGESELYRLNTADSLRGAWYDKKNNKIYFIESGEKKEWTCLNTDETTINEFDSYQSKLVKLNGVYSDNEVRITANQDGQITREEMTISVMTRDFIRFSNGIVWKRI